MKPDYNLCPGGMKGLVPFHSPYYYGDMIYLYTQLFSNSEETPFWQAVYAAANHAEDVIFVVATRAMQQNLRERFRMRQSQALEGDLTIITMDDLVFQEKDDFASLGFTQVYLLEKLLRVPGYADLIQERPVQSVAQSFFATFQELQRHCVTPEALAAAYRKAVLPQEGQALGQKTVALYREFLAAVPTWPFSSIYQPYQNISGAALAKQLSGKTVFMFGFWELPPYQRQLLIEIEREAALVALLLHYSPLSPVYEAAQQFYTWLCRQFSVREIPFLGEGSKAAIRLLQCDSPSQEVEVVVQNKWIFQENNGVLVSETEPYAPLLRQAMVGNETMLPAYLAHDPLVSFLLAFMDPELPEPHAVSRLLSHALVTTEIPGWHWPTIEKTCVPTMKNWSWEQWYHVLPASLAVYVLSLAEMFQRSLDRESMQVCCDMVRCACGVSEWPVGLLETIQNTFQILEQNQKNISSWNTKFPEILKAILLSEREGVPGYGKFEAYMVQKSVWVVLGCRDGVWPKITRRAHALPAAVARAVGFPGPADYMGTDAYVFHAVLHQAQTETILLYPTQHDDVPQSVTVFLSGILAEPVSVDMQASAGSPAIRGDAAIVTEKWQKEGRFQTFSPTALTRYQACPYRYYLAEVVGLPEFIEGLDVGGALLGELIHTVLQRVSIGASEAVLQKAVDMAILSQQKKRPDSVWSWILSTKKDLLLGSVDVPGILPETFAAVEDLDLPLVRIATEISLSFPFEVGDQSFELKGRIDAIYQIEGTNQILVVDYKTGSTSYTKKELQTYRQLQLPVYMLLAQRAYPDHQVVGAALMYVRHRDPGWDIMALTEDGKRALDLKRKRPLIIDALYHEETLFHVADCVRAIRDGQFGVQDVAVAAPFLSKRKETCRTCAYKWVCTYPDRFLST